MTDNDAMTTRAALFAAGALPAGKIVAPSAAAMFESAVLALSAEMPIVAPPARLKQTILDRLPPPDPPFLFRHLGDEEFLPSAFRGVTYRLLHEDRSRGRLAALVRMAPGSLLHGHPHAEDGEAEECLVLEGELTVGDVVMKPGDYQRAAPGSLHREQRSETGALLYITGTLDFLLT